MSDTPKVVFLHGLGQTRGAWEPVARALPQTECSCLDIFRMQPPLAGWSLDGASRQIADSIYAPVHLVGLSLGAVIALDIAITYPDKVASLFLSAPQARPPRMLMRLQSVLMRVLPAKWVCPPQLSKPELLVVLKSLAGLDLTPGLPGIKVPTTVACGSSDKANLPAAHKIAQSIPDASLKIIPGVGHQWQVTHPELFAKHLTQHLDL